MGFRGFVRFRGFQACLCFFCFVVAPFFLSLRVLFFLVVARDFSCRGVGFFSCRGNGAPSSGLLFLKAATGKQK